ncbi:hypothetical protein [Burkholderia glumae]|uniref:Uncharacterized protein n=1 Tax=Burkholderia glumae TaxID=337 RepID=A0AAP9Y1P2_BURGL|nr:hypothetical protein [Burkholderia glumae]MCM2482730.1 hypothetical protein [Burkholderia glumae]MCM2507128.1 hypothetical protein [Burkholderia glumae]QHE11425.1 hypothetical protein GQR88_14025 [Burkholderia glumae AU6208]QJP72205.1 hypothetical protein HJC54_18880 [Burkholderia glumae]QPQ92881.1 hypothetical protein I6H06_28025 [Burkholderia glumae]
MSVATSVDRHQRLAFRHAAVLLGRVRDTPRTAKAERACDDLAQASLLSGEGVNSCRAGRHQFDFTQLLE